MTKLAVTSIAILSTSFVVLAGSIFYANSKRPKDVVPVATTVPARPVTTSKPVLPDTQPNKPKFDTHVV